MRPAKDASDLRGLVATDKFFWLETSGGGAAVRADLFTHLGLEDPDLSWVQRFG